MNQIKTGKYTAAVLGWVSAGALVACAPARSEYAPPEGLAAGEAARAIAGNQRLSAAEWSTYMADHVYVNSIVKPGVRVRLNMADPRQHAFVMARLKLAGKTPQNSPYLFERLEERREQHLAAGYKAGSLSPEPFPATTSERQERHEITNASIAGAGAGGASAAGGIATAAPVQGSAFSTYPDGSYYSWLDVSYSTVYGYPIGPLNYDEEFERADGAVGADMYAETSGDSNLSPVKKWIVSSYKMEDSPTGFVESYRYEPRGSDNEALGGPLILSAPTIAEPVDHTGDGLISLCVNRRWTHDCDRVLDERPDTYWNIEIPLSGEIHAHSTHTFSQGQVDELLDILPRIPDYGPAGSLTVALQTNGGGCPVRTRSDFSARMLAFWKTVQIKDNGRTFSWNLTGNEIGTFDQACAIHDDAKIVANIPLVLFDDDLPGVPITTSMTLSTDLREVPTGAGLIGRTVITNSCLAAGTKILLKNGKSRAIESLKIGHQVSNPYDRSDRALTIMDTAEGIEPTPMVRIVDEAGHSLLLTEMHPLATPDRGMVQARMLRVGDQVMTTSGASKLTEVSREAYSGKVYNLKVGSESEQASLGPDQTIVYANGFVVGDGQIQSKYEDLALEAIHRPASEIPSQWRVDYELSKQRD